MKLKPLCSEASAGSDEPGLRPAHAKGITRYLLLLLACISLGVALLGIILPGLPTTEFLLLSAWAAARSSPRLHNWMLQHRLLGPLLAQWQLGCLPRKAKWAATTTMSLAAIMLLVSLHHLPSLIFCLVSMAGVLVWLWRKPEQATAAQATEPGPRY